MELKTVGLTKKFGSKIAVDDLNITLANGCLLYTSFSDYQPGSATAGYRAMVDEAYAAAERQKARVDPMYQMCIRDRPGADEKYPYPLLAEATASQAIPQAGKGGCKAGCGCGWENCHSHRTPDRPGSGICQKSSRRCRGRGALCVAPVCYAVLFLYHYHARTPI